MSLLRIVLFVLLICFLVTTSSAQEDEITCPNLVQTVLAAVDSDCKETGRNQACYGNIMLTAVPQVGIEKLGFDAPGDRVDVTHIQFLVLSSMNESTGEWGISLMKLQANLPDTLPGQNVTVLLFGDVTIENAVDDTSEGYTPMQMIYFQSGIGDARCFEAPPSGILIQTPEDVGQIELVVNEVRIALGSTAFLQAAPGDALYVYLIEGRAEVTALSETRTVLAGMGVHIPLDENLAASGPPDVPEPYAAEMVESLAGVLAILPESVTLSEPDSIAEIEPVTDEQVACTVTAESNVNLRNGPGTIYDRAGGLAANNSALPTGQVWGTDGFVWWQLDDKSWVRSDVVQSTGDCGGLPVVMDIPSTPTPAPIQNSQEQVSENYNGSVTVDCSTIVVNAGRVTLSGGIIRGWTTCEDALAAGEGVWFATFTGTGPTPTNYTSGHCYWDDRHSEWGISTGADVVLTPGEYTYTVTFPAGEGYSHSCTLIVQ